MTQRLLCNVRMKLTTQIIFKLLVGRHIVKNREGSPRARYFEHLLNAVLFSEIRSLVTVKMMKEKFFLYNNYHF